MSSLRPEAMRDGLTTSPVLGSTRWISARRRAEIQSAVGLGVIDRIPYGYETGAPTTPVLRSILTSWWGWRFPGWRPAHIASGRTTSVVTANGNWIGCPIAL